MQQAAEGTEWAVASGSGFRRNDLTETVMAVTDAPTGLESEAIQRGHTLALEQLRACCTEYGYLASTTELNNYRRIWARDGCICSLAALMTRESDLVAGVRATLETLLAYQGPHGEIPSNVEPLSGRVSYGGTTGRVDANLWFIITCGEYWRVTGDDAFLETVLEAIERVRFLLGAWEFNSRGLIYVPIGGDWADEYIQNGYVLYDQALYYQALRTVLAIHRHTHQSTNHQLRERVSRLRHLIARNFWFDHDDDAPEDVYHEIIYQKGRKAAPRTAHCYWMPFFSPAGYGYRFDALANAMVSLVGVSTKRQRMIVDAFIDENVVHQDIMLLPAFHPSITPVDTDWEDLQMTFSYTFKNKPHEYHNGGLWPMVTGFYAADLAQRRQTDRAIRYLEGLHRANALVFEDVEHCFPEFLHGTSFEPGGTMKMGWSAAAAVMVYEALRGRRVFQTPQLNAAGEPLETAEW